MVTENFLKNFKNFSLISKEVLLFNTERCDCGNLILAPNSVKVKIGSLQNTIDRLEDLGLTEINIPNSEGYFDDRNDGTCCDLCK